MAKAEISSEVEVDSLAFQLYSDRIAKMPAQTNGDDVARWAYRKAEEFVGIRERVKSGDTAVLKQSRLADAAAPNLKPNHPLNLVSQRYCEANGGEAKVLATVAKILAWLASHPASDENPIALDQIDRFDPSTRFDWDVPATNLARTILPAYASN